MLTTFPDEETGEVRIKYDDETMQGNFFEIGMDDQHGLELMAQLCKFYQAKGFNAVGFLQGLGAKPPSLWQRLFGRKP